MDTEDRCKCREVAKQLIGQFVESNSTVALDSGDLCTAMIQEIGDSLTEGTLKNVSIVAACDSAATEAAFVGVPQAQSADLDAVCITQSLRHHREYRHHPVRGSPTTLPLDPAYLSAVGRIVAHQYKNSSGTRELSYWVQLFCTLTVSTKRLCRLMSCSQTLMR